MTKQSWIIFWITIFVVLASVLGQTCTQWPADFKDSTWEDSAFGDLVFTTNTMTGYTIQGLSAYNCQDDSQFASDGLLVIRSTNTFVFLSNNWYVYVCMKLTRLTDSSYTYYLQKGQEANVGEYRAFINLDGTKLVADACNAGEAASGSEFVTMIKQSDPSTAYTTCPDPLKGRFEYNYTAADDTSHCDSTVDNVGHIEHMDVCTDNTKLNFLARPTLCSQSIVYAPAEVYCVASYVSGTDTFVQLYNPGTVDSSATFRFSCMAIRTADSLVATVVPGNCTKDMTSSTRAVNHAGTTIGSKIDFYPYVFCKGGCNWPSTFASSTWLDNTRGSLVFTATTMTGLTVNIQSNNIANWECLDSSFFSSEGILLIKSTDTFRYLENTWITYLCLQMSMVTADSYIYYQKHPQDPVGAEERLKFSIDGSLTTKSDICSSTTVPTAEFHFIVKQGQESAAKQYCPPSLLAKMDYTHTTSANSVTCDTSNDDWDVCTDRMEMKFNYTTCSTQMAYSSTGSVWCMYNMTSTHEYVVVYNTDTSPTFKFACIVSNSAGTAASFVNNNCTDNMTPTDFAKDHAGSDIGYKTTMTAKETCPFVGNSTSTDATEDPSSGSSILPLIIGAVIGVLALAIIIGVIIYCCKRKKKVEHNDDNEKKGIPQDNGTNTVTVIDEKIKVEDMDNPALTVHPERNTLTPLPVQNGGAGSVTPRVIPPIVNNHV